MEESLKIIGENNNFQFYLKIILFSCAFLTDIYSMQIPFMLNSYNLISINNITDINLTDYCNNDNNISTKTLNYNTTTTNDPLSLSIIKNWIFSFNLYCENQKYILIIQISIIIGNILGLLIISPLPDKYGREKFLKYSLIINLILHLNLLFILNIYHLIIINFLGGVNSYIYVLSFVLIAEYLPSNKTGLNIGIFNSMSNIFGIFLILIIKIFKYWRSIYVVTIIINIYLIKYFFKYILESPRWLLSTGQKIKCFSVLDKIAVYNGNLTNWNDYQKEQLELNNKFGKKSTNSENFENLFCFDFGSSDFIKLYSICEIWKIKKMEIIKFFMMWFLISWNYYGGILNLFKFYNKKNCSYFEKISFIFLIMIFSNIISGFLSDKFGRKLILFLASIIGIIGFICYFFNIFEKLKLVFLSISVFCFCSSNNIFFIYTVESIQIPIRNTICGWVFTSTKFAKIFIYVFFNYLSDNITGYFFIVFSFIILIKVIFYMNETLGSTLPNIIQLEERKKSEDSSFKGLLLDNNSSSSDDSRTLSASMLFNIINS